MTKWYVLSERDMKKLAGDKKQLVRLAVWGNEALRPDTKGDVQSQVDGLIAGSNSKEAVEEISQRIDEADCDPLDDYIQEVSCSGKYDDQDCHEDQDLSRGER